jgi:hypothetical protein
VKRAYLYIHPLKKNGSSGNSKLNNWSKWKILGNQYTNQIEAELKKKLIELVNHNVYLK